ncbi:hypothetical protein SAMN00120144_0473 [Hymenobacter roseosalivarius DSM 11622]|uniref:Uncharacterized protein n=1 Tax=Hymenobacter roseosalivarius DSM 11622 TaxID=645990 RepID=A0A1W1VR07_9BACT|nr:hypothetical protein [Hymenobacter roseosalivarius]SMB95805.1 hypothetical protein SAMN00120144_0473 [Hymenobacter roseosalivarius DSM 11622]
MKKFLAGAVLALSGLFIAPAHAQVSPPTPDQEAGAKPRKQKSKDEPADVARMQRRMNMNPDEAKRDQQLEILEARSGGSTANTSFGRGSGPARQYDKGTGGFTVKKFKDKRIGTAKQKRGLSHAAPGIDPKGKPLKHKKRKGFLFFN